MSKVDEALKWLRDGCQYWVNHMVIGSKERSISVDKRIGTINQAMQEKDKRIKELEERENAIREIINSQTNILNVYGNDSVIGWYEFYSRIKGVLDK